MEYGVVYPQTEVPPDPGWIRTFAQTVESSGYNHVLAYEHILGVDAGHPRSVQGPYGLEDHFLSPLLMFTSMAAVTDKLGFATAVLVLPQRDAILVAKQAASLDVLCGGRLRVGVGVGWNAAEFDAIGADFHDRGRRVEEQVAVLRALWTQPKAEFTGDWYRFAEVGIRPLPIQQPIPIWFGGYVDASLKRVAKMGQGWFPGFSNVDDAKPTLDTLVSYVEAEGRAWEEIGIEVRIHYEQGNLDALGAQIEAWSQVGVTHLSLNTMRSGLKDGSAHLRAIERFAGLFNG
jgi:probable F420-dependent oxidoreductase